ncbi:MAG: aerobic C4-dicarboxylate transport protein [Acetobacteraceae bacterium]|nr:aerobic C4-dicarboxylate transport protein [Acetobacteraceae bacterium]
MRIFGALYIQVLIGVVIGSVLGFLAPQLATEMKPLGDTFIGLIHLLIAPLVFCTVSMGVARVSNLGQAGRIAVKALIYFLVVSTFALVIGFLVGLIVQPGAGMHIDPATLSMKGLEKYQPTESSAGSFVDMLMRCVPTNFFEPFLKGDVIQIVVLAVATGAVLSGLGERARPVTAFIDSFMQVLFRLVRMVMYLAPIGAFGAIAFTIGKYGVHTLISLGWLVGAMYATSALFVVVVLGFISAAWCKLSIFDILSYIKTELLIVLGTSTSESVFPQLTEKLERLGCSRMAVGLVLPTGYSFNLDGGQIYLSLGAMFIAQALDIHLGAEQLVTLCIVMVIVSKGSAGVSGAAFVALAASLASTNILPIAGLGLVLGVDRFMSEARALVNVVGCFVATIVVAKWEGEFDLARARAVLADRENYDNPTVPAAAVAGAETMVSAARAA